MTTGFASVIEDVTSQTYFASVTEDATNQTDFASVTEDATNETDFALVIEDVACRIAWTICFSPVTVDAASQTDLIVGLFLMTEFIDPFATVIEGVTVWTIGV